MNEGESRSALCVAVGYDGTCPHCRATVPSPSGTPYPEQTTGPNAAVDTSSSIPDEAVEAAAKWLFDLAELKRNEKRRGPSRLGEWDYLTETGKNRWRCVAQGMAAAYAHDREDDFADGPFTYHAEYENADDVTGTIEADGIMDAITVAANDLQRQTGSDPIAYGRLTKLTIKSASGEVTTTVTPEY